MIKVLRFAPILLLALMAGCEVGVESTPTVGNQQPAVDSTPVGSPATTDKVARGNLKFVEGYQAGYQAALETGKPMLVFFTAEWCHFCHQMANEAFTHEQVVGLSERFVCILVDADAEPDICQQFHVQSFPTIQFLSPRGVPLNRVVGKKPGHQLVMAMQAALQNVARRSEPAAATIR